MPQTDVEITELEEFEPSRVDGVKSAANGFPILMLKSTDAGDVTETEATLDDVLAELDKAEGDDKRPPCPLCRGDGKIKNGHVKCPKCQGSGFKPMPGDTEKSLKELAAAKESGVSASGAETEPPPDCPTCNGGGNIPGDAEKGITCPDCGGSGKDSTMPTDDKLSRMDGDPGSVTEGAGGRETIDKAELEKRNMDPNVGGGVDRDKIPAEDFAGKDRSYPIVKPGDVSDAASSIGRAGPDNYSADQLKANIIAIAKRKGASFVAELPDAWKSDGAEKQMADGATFTGLNPSATDDSGDTPDDATMPGSPDWEAVDAETATNAAMALMGAAELIRQFAQRESIEVAAGEGNDIFDAGAAQMALCDVTHALGIMAQMAFHEGLEAQKSAGDDVEKAGKRLSTKSVAALAAARDHITALLGDDDPAKKTTDDETTKSVFIDDQEVISMELTTEEFDSRVASAVVKALIEVKKAKKAKTKTAPEADETVDTEVATDETPETDETAKAEAEVDDAELSPEEIEADKAAKKARKELKAAKKAKKEAAENAAIKKALEESKAEAEEAVKALEQRLEETTSRLTTVEKMAAPVTVARTATPEGRGVAKQRDEFDLEIARLETIARSATDPDIRKGNIAKADALRAQRSAL